jgi:hypothetical protein
MTESQNDQLRSYPKIYNMGHRAIRDLFQGPVVVQEKVDGSQFTFGVIDGVLRMRSRGREIHPPVTDKLFRMACETAQRLADDGRLIENVLYRGEAITSPKHNTLEYARIPEGGVVLFDVDVSLENRVPPQTLRETGEHLGLEVVPTIHVGKVESVEALRALLDRESFLGGAKIEGVVAKNYARWGEDGKMLMGKVVSEAFKEQHTKSWKGSNPGRGDILEAIRETYRHERRWEKAIEHLRDAGTLDSSPKDIGALIREVQVDVEEECMDEIKEALWRAFWPEIRRGTTAGLPEWYKTRLAEQQFAQEDDAWRRRGGL